MPLQRSDSLTSLSVRPVSGFLRLSLEWCAKQHEVSVVCHEGRGLSTHNAYVKLYLSGADGKDIKATKRKTKAMKQTNSPRFEQTFKISAASKSGSAAHRLQITVWDHAGLKAHCHGGCSVPVAEIAGEAHLSGWFQLFAQSEGRSEYTICEAASVPEASTRSPAASPTPKPKSRGTGGKAKKRQDDGSQSEHDARGSGGGSSDAQMAATLGGMRGMANRFGKTDSGGTGAGAGDRNSAAGPAEPAATAVAPAADSGSTPLTQTPAPAPTPSQPAATRKTSVAIDKVVARHQYSAAHPDELSFEAGDIILVSDKRDTGWWAGHIGDRAGYLLRRSWRRVPAAPDTRHPHPHPHPHSRTKKMHAPELRPHVLAPPMPSMNSADTRAEGGGGWGADVNARAAPLPQVVPRVVRRHRQRCGRCQVGRRQPQPGPAAQQHTHRGGTL